MFNSDGGNAMNWDRVQGNWKQFKGSVQEKWSKLTNDHLNAIDGRREILTGKIQEAYGIGKDEAERQINDWHQSLPDVANDPRAETLKVNARR
jgi:uncharacterized protein YjbJ (UPF0337 family)